MLRIWPWVKRLAVALYVLVTGAIGGGGGHVIVDRREMYGDDPRNDPYSIAFDPSHRPTRDR